MLKNKTTKELINDYDNSINEGKKDFIRCSDISDIIEMSKGDAYLLVTNAMKLGFMSAKLSNLWAK